MSLIECPEYKRLISDQANVCPRCGYPGNVRHLQIKDQNAFMHDLLEIRKREHR